MSNYRPCKKCRCRCSLISLGCLLDGLTILNLDLGSDLLKAGIDKAQIRYIKPLLGDCFDELCTSLLNSELETTDPNYEPLDPKWKALVDQLEYLIRVSTEYLITQKIASGKLTSSGIILRLKDVTDAANLRYILGLMKTEVDELYAELKQWLSDNSSTYGCLPDNISSDDCCKSDCADSESYQRLSHNERYYREVDGFGWGTTYGK